MEFTKDNSILELLPNNIKIKDTSNNSVVLNSNGNINIDNRTNFFTDWNSYYSTVNSNNYHGSNNNINIVTTGGNISLGNPEDALFSGRFRHYNFDVSNINEDFLTSRFIGTQIQSNNEYNTSTRYSGLEIMTNYSNNNNFATWNENLNFYTTKNASTKNPDLSLNSVGNLSATIACLDQLTLKNTERFGSFIVDPPSIRNISSYVDSMAQSHLLYTDLMNLEIMKLCHNYIPSQKLEVNNGNIAFTSYYNSSLYANSFNFSENNKINTLNKHTITGLNQIIYDTTGSGNYEWKWGNGIGSFLNYGRGYYEFPEDQLQQWSGNGNNEEGTDLYHYNNNLNDQEQKKFRRNMMNNVMMTGMMIEQKLNGHSTFIDEHSSSGLNSYNTDVENKQPPSESIHFLTYNKNNKEWLGDTVYKGPLGSKLTIGEDSEADIYNKKSYGGEIRMTIKDNGCVGIGTTEPEYHFEVNNYKFINGTGGIFLGKRDVLAQLYSESAMVSNNFTEIGGIASFANFPISAKLSDMLLCRGISIYSDKRIKTDIENVPDGLALEQVNKLETKYYNYKDPLQKKVKKVIGFIAQETKEVIPNAVNIIKEYIPDELKFIDNPIWNKVNDKWHLTINNIHFTDNHTGNCKFHVTNDISNTNIEIKVKKVEKDKKTFIFDNKYSNVALWGKEVNDFHTIDKNMIFALHHSAIQELSKENVKKTNKIIELENENKSLNDRLKLIEQKLGI